MPELRGRTLRTREVLDDDELFVGYAERVPVLRLGDVELEWPFDPEAFRLLLHRMR